jgi:ornithine cyclodeaminase/alanine dehydrogenase-like protein (mu-crystallin family)
MKEGLTYKTPEGESHKILMFDELNKMVYINVIGSNHKWVHENEYSTWVVNDTAEMPKIYIPDMPAQMTDEQAESVGEVATPAKKRKKKSEE